MKDIDKNSISYKRKNANCPNCGQYYATTFGILDKNDNLRLDDPGDFNMCFPVFNGILNLAKSGAYIAAYIRGSGKTFNCSNCDARIKYDCANLELVLSEV